jgi:RNA polymerase sigma-70 factor (ECF subfamily)
VDAIVPVASDDAAADADAVLVAAARQDPRAFTFLYDRYLDPVYRFCYVRLGSREAAEDATSDVFLKALAGLNEFRGGSFPAWLYRIAHNVVADSYRKARPSMPMHDQYDPIDPSESPEELVISSSEREALAAALAQLPDDQRVAVELQLAGWSGEQIAEALGKSPGAVRMLRLRALQRLRELLQPGKGGAHARA